MNRILELPFYPFILAAYAPIYQFSKNHGLFSDIDLLIGIISQLTITAIALILARRFMRTWHQAGLFVTLLWILLFAFRQFNDNQPYDELIYLSLIVLPLSVAIYYSIRRWNPKLDKFSHIFNLGGILLVVMPVYSLVSEKIAANSVLNGWPGQHLSLSNDAKTTKPNIIHILLDGYSRGDVLKEVYQFDNSPFEKELGGMGFYVAKNVTTPYNQTVLVLSSIFNSEYLPVFDNKQIARIQKTALTSQLQQNSIKKILVDFGYTFITTMSPYKPVRILTSNKIFPDEYSMGTTQMFMVTMYDRTPFGKIYRSLTKRVKSKTSIAALTDYALHNPYYEKINERPFFIFQHVLSPHAPFNVDENGNVDVTNESILEADHLTEGLDEKKLLYRAGYVSKLKYTNKAILKQVRNIINYFSGPLIIIIHGDHGGGMHTYSEDYERTCIKERFSPFFAIYSRGVDIDYRDIDSLNLVNLYRVIFNESFNSDVTLLENVNYFAPWSNLAEIKNIEKQRMIERCPTL